MSNIKLNELKEQIDSINTEIDLRFLISHLKILASNMRSKREVVNLIEKFITKANQISDFESTVFLHGLLILQLENDINNLNRIISLLEEMRHLAHEINYKEGIAFSYSFSWYVEKIQGNEEKSGKEIKNAIELLNEIPLPDEFIYHFINYSYAVEKWLKDRNSNIVEILESCFVYFFENCLFHSLAMTLGILIIVYQQTQNKEQSMKLIRRILSSRDILIKMPEEIQSIFHYFMGVGHKLCFNLNEAEKHLLETQSILKPIYKKSIYSEYYLTTLSHLTTTYALQGRLELAVKQMKEVERLLEEGIATKNLDSFNKKQIIHTFNLTKFYIKSRLSSFTFETEQELIQTIFNNLDKYHSNAIMFSEFLLNANLSKDQLIKIRNLANPSTRRVEHIINFLVEKTIHTEEQQVLRYTSILQRRPVEERMTYIEKALADLLAAREYYRIKRFAEIYPLLKRYEKQLHRIEVQELRVFMEAFIQVGAYKNGDPLGPALQYIAIKKCRHYGFSSLESKLLNYLDMQYKDIQSFIR